MFDYSVIVCGCTQNSAKYISNNLSKLYEMKKLFKDFHFVVYENDSKDDTANILNDFKEKHSNFNCICEKDIYKNIPTKWSPHTRILFITYCRNQILKYINAHYSTYDFMIMVDLDDVISEFNVDNLIDIFNDNNITQYDALFANCIGNYYDISALRINDSVWVNEIHAKLWNSPIDYDCWEKARGGNIQKYVYDNQVDIPASSPLIPVSSAFGGFGIYKMSKIKNCWYNGIDNNRIVCEHVQFHKQMRELNDAKMCICPQFSVNKQDHHTKPK